jgi:hypothetical protein
MFRCRHPSAVHVAEDLHIDAVPLMSNCLDGPGWCLYETGRRRRFEHAGTSRGLWRTADLDGQALLALPNRYRSGVGPRLGNRCVTAAPPTSSASDVRIHAKYVRSLASVNR